MAIVNLNGAVAGLQPPITSARTYVTPPQTKAIDTFFLGGGTPDTTLNGVVLSSTGGVVAGQIFHMDPPGGTNAYLARFEASAATVPFYAAICDRLWHNGGITITSTSAQTIVSPTWPARDNNGATSGDGVLIGMTVSAATGAGTPTASLSYTNSAGTAGRTAALTEGTAGSSTAGMFYRFGLQAGDAGVQSVQSLTFTAAWASGTVNLVAYRVLAVVEVLTALAPFVIDATNGGFPQLYNGVVPFPLLLLTSTTGQTVYLTYQETQG